MKTSTSTERVRRFLKEFNFYRRFPLGFLGLEDPLFRLIRGRTPFLWGPKQKATFARLLQFLASAPFL